MSHVAHIVYQKYVNGDSISDDELKEALKFFKDVSDKLMVMGPVFKLAANEAIKVYLALDGFTVARRHHAKELKRKK